MNADFVSEVPSLKLIAWKALISAGRRNDDIHDLLSKTAKESETEGHGLGSFMEDAKDMNIRDTFWHGRTIFHLTGSRAGFLVLPSFVAMVMASLIITASQVTVYACSRGQLSNLQLASSPSLEFHPWQTRYEVLVDRLQHTLGRHEDVMMVEPLGVPEVRLLFKVRRGWALQNGPLSFVDFVPFAPTQNWMVLNEVSFIRSIGLVVGSVGLYGLLKKVFHDD